MNTAKKINPAKRRKARRFALQAIYQWQLTGHGVNVIANEFANEPGMEKADTEYFQDLLQGVIAEHAMLDQHLQPLLDRPVPELDPIELAILRMGAYELAQHVEIPYRVVINEAVELAKAFGAADGHKYINGVLDRVAKKIRPEALIPSPSKGEG